MRSQKDILFSILIFILRLFIVDLEVSELVAIFSGGNHTEPITQVVLLQVSLGEGNIRCQCNLCFLSLHGQLLAKIVGLASNLDALMKIFFKISTVHNAILNRVGAVNEELDLVLFSELLHSFTLTLQLLLARF